MMDDYYINVTLQEFKHDKHFELYFEMISVIMLSILSICLDTFIIYCIGKYNVENKRKRDALITNWCMLNFLLQLITVLHLLINLTKFLNYIGYSLMSITFIGMIIITIILMVDDIYDDITENSIKLWMITFRIILIALLIFELIVRYYKNLFITTYFFLPLSFVTFLIYVVQTFVIIANYLKKYNVNEEVKFRYKLSSILVWSRFLQFILIIQKIDFPTITIIHFIEVLQIFLVLLLLIKCDVNFKEYVMKLILRKKSNEPTMTVHYNNMETV